MTQQVQQPARNASSIAGAGGEQISRETTLLLNPFFILKILLLLTLFLPVGSQSLSLLFCLLFCVQN